MSKTQKDEKTNFGLEIEAFTLDSEGNLLNKADELLKKLEKEKDVGRKMQKEISHSMIEMATDPHPTVASLAKEYLEDLKKIIEISEKEGIHLLTLGCYPANSKPKMRTDVWYALQEALLGKQNVSHMNRICGFHFHCSLPKGVVGKKSKSIKRLTYSDEKDTFLNIYNFAVAAESACITFLQSSPFLEGKHHGKDCRTLAYRDLVIPGEIYGTYHILPIFGGLPHYEFTLEDLRDLASRRKNTYLELLRAKNLSINEIMGEPDLKFMWGPIRVNKIGTLEFRGFDMNCPKKMIPVAFLIESAVEAIKEKELQMLPSDIGIAEPFKIEDDIIYLPPYSIVKSIELLSSRYGFENSAVYTYCSRFFEFILKISKPKDKNKFKEIKKMLEEKKTTSDEILALVKKNGYDPKNVPEDFLKYIASYYSNRLGKEVDESIKLFSSFK